jgi:hypothetical protein
MGARMAHAEPSRTHLKCLSEPRGGGFLKTDCKKVAAPAGIDFLSSLDFVFAKK